MSLGVENMSFYVFVGAPTGPDPRRAPPGPRAPQGPIPAEPHQGPGESPAGPDPRRAPLGPRAPQGPIPAGPHQGPGEGPGEGPGDGPGEGPPGENVSGRLKCDFFVIINASIICIYNMCL